MTLRWQIAQFCELLWWQHYLKKREQTTYLNWKKSYWRQFLADAGVIVPPGAYVLDAGCGPAGIFSVLPTQKVDAIDPLLDLYERNLPHFKRKDYPNVSFINNSLESYRSNTRYDLVFCLNAINHVAHLDICLQQLHHNTKPGGLLVLTTDAHRFKLLQLIFRWLPGDILHPQQWDMVAYQAQIQEVGYNIQAAATLKKGLIFNYVLILATKSHAEETARALPSRPDEKLP
jgi:2-polyprenyl-6-hydroxyphenyl methylase/3-demethylubiquinone-9 3-methyltransferase